MPLRWNLSVRTGDEKRYYKDNYYLLPHSLAPSLSLLLSHSRHQPPPPPESQRHPPANQAHPTQRRDGSERLKLLWVEHEQVDGAAEHGHAGREEGHCEFVARRGVRCEEEDGGVEELFCVWRISS